MSDNPRPVAVIGGGTLGRRIALMFCTGGDVRLVDPAAEQREAAAEYVARELPRLTDAAPGRLTVYEQILDGVADAWLIIECVPERLD
ncbi:MAG: 3-hydroxybutyryl-CoA dehydrogenase, partial [Frankiaceae bacterium]|nr:3-hydroxybutyryl-CoA dehydrogenase [Frankiaceae bacterium]